MRLNQVTVTMPDLDAGWNFYCVDPWRVDAVTQR
jgi:hypothetical protein